MADVTLPSLGESVTEGIVTRWMKAVGDPVERDEALYEISTDKVDSEMPSPASGVLAEIRVPEGDTAAVGAVLAVISEDGSAVPAPRSDEVPSAPLTQPPSAAAAPEGLAPVATGRVTSPLVRRDLASAGALGEQVPGSGPGGRVTRRDVAARAPAPAIGLEASFGSTGPATAFVVAEARFDAVDLALSSPAAEAAQAEGLHLSHSVVATRAAVEALAEFPRLNGWRDGGELVVEASRHIGVEVELEQGLVAPVVQDAQDVTLRGLARRIDELTEQARDRSLGVEELLGATFAVSSGSAEGALLAAPALRSPLVAAMSIGPISRRAVVDGEGADERVAVASVGMLGLTYDADLIEPSVAAGFLSRVSELIASSDWAAQL